MGISLARNVFFLGGVKVGEGHLPNNHMPSRKGNFVGAQVLTQVRTILEQLSGRRSKGWGDRLFLEGAREWRS